MARLQRDGWVVEAQGPGALLVCSDLHGNLADLRRMVALWEAEPDAALLFLGDLFHGPSATEAQWRQKYDHLADWYPDESVQVFRELSALCALHPERVVSLLGNHDHAHVGGPVVSKFHADEAGAMEAQMEPHEREALRAFLRGLPIIGVSSCGAAFTHAAPPGDPFGRKEVEELKLEGYERVPLHSIHRAGLLGSLLWLRGSAHGSVGRFLEHLHLARYGGGGRCHFVVHGHEIAPEGFECEHARICNLSTSFGMKRAQKRYLRLDLSRRYEDALSLRAGHELLPLYEP